MKNHLKTAFAAIAMTVVSIAGASAQDVANNTPFGDWRVSCDAVSVSQTFCQLVQQQSVLDTNELAGRFAAFPAQNGGAILLAQVPIGVYLPGGAVFRLDDNDATPQQEMVWQRCLGPICEAAILLDEATVSQMSSSGAMLFGYRMDSDAEPIVLRVNLNRFGEGIEALRGAQ